MQRSGLVLALLATALLAAPAALASGEVALAPPVHFDGEVDIQAPGGALDLLDGHVPLTVSVTTGSVDVWTERTPCLQRQESSCIPSQTEVQRKTIELQPGSTLVLEAPSDRGYRVLLSAAGELDVVGDGGALDLLATDSTRSHAGGAPDAVSRLELPEGPVAHPDAATIAARGPIDLKPFNATVRLIDLEGNERTLVTGWSWTTADNGVYENRQLQLVGIHVDGRVAFAWDGAATVAPAVPFSLEADEATLRLLDGALPGSEAGDGERTVNDLALTVTGHDAERGERGAILATAGVPLADQPPEDDEDLGTVALVGAGAALAAMVGAVGYYWPRMSWGLAVLGLPMYSRIERSELLEHDVREALYEYIQNEPGIHAHALSEKAEIGWGTTVYHLRLMERNRLITSERKGRYRRFFPAAGFLAKKREVLSVLQNDTTNAIARLILREPGLNQKAICEALDISPSLANWHLNRLLGAELVNRERRGRTVHYFPGDAWEDVQDVVDMDAAAS